MAQPNNSPFTAGEQAQYNSLMQGYTPAAAPVAAAPVAAEPAQPEWGNFRQGLRSATTAVGGQLHALAGQVGETFGADDFAAQQHAQSLAAQQQSQHEAQGMTTSYTGVHDLRSGVNYLTGMAGQALPTVGAGLAGALAARYIPGGRTAAGAMLGNAVGMAPSTVGEQIEAQKNDPAQAARPVGERNIAALVGGGLRAGAMAAVPGHVESGLLGAGEAAARVPFGQALLREVPAAAAGNALAGAASSEIGHQAATALNPNRDTSQDAAQNIEAAGNMGIGGAAFGVVGAAGAARPRMPDMPNMLGAKTPDIASPGLDAIKQGATDAGNAIGGAVAKGWSKAMDVLGVRGDAAAPTTAMDIELGLHNAEDKPAAHAAMTDALKPLADSGSEAAQQAVSALATPHPEDHYQQIAELAQKAKDGDDATKDIIADTPVLKSAARAATADADFSTSSDTTAHKALAQIGLSTVTPDQLREQGATKIANDLGRPELIPLLQGISKAAWPEQARDPYQMLTGVGTHARDMLAAIGSPILDNPHNVNAAVRAFTDTINAAATGEGDWKPAMMKLAERLDTADKMSESGDAGQQFAEAMKVLVNQQYGEGTAAAKRVIDGLNPDNAAPLIDAKTEFADQLKPGADPQHVMGQMRTDLQVSDADYKAAHAAHITDLEQQVVAAKDTPDELSLGIQLARAKARPPTVMDGMQSKYESLFKNPKAYERALSALQKYEKSGVDRPPTAAPVPGQNAANHLAEPDLNDFEHQQKAAERSAGLGEHADGTEDRDERDTHQVQQHEVTYHGAEHLRPGLEDETPVSHLPSADYQTKQGMRAEVGENAHAMYGHHTKTEWQSVEDWAREKADAGAGKYHELMNDAMHRVAAHDVLREPALKAAAKRFPVHPEEFAPGINPAEDLSWLHTRRQRVEGGMNGHAFFNEKGGQHYGLYRMEGGTHANLELPADQLKYYAPRDGETNQQYIERQAAAMPGNRLKNAAVVRDSLMAVKTKGGIINIDVPRLVDAVLKRHQEGDIIGATPEAKAGERQLVHDKSVEVKKRYTTDDIGKAFANVYSTIEHEGFVGKSESEHGKVQTTEHGNKPVQNFNPLQVIYRNGDQVVRMKDISNYLGRDAEGKTVYNSSHFTNKLDTPNILSSMAETNKKFNKYTPGVRREHNVGSYATAQASKAGAEGFADRLQKAGVIRGFNGMKDLNVRELLLTMMDRYGIPRDKLNEMDSAHAAALVKDGMKELGGVPDMKKEWTNVEVYKRPGKDGDYAVTVGKLMGEKSYDRPASGGVKAEDMPRGDISAAKVHILDRQIADTINALETDAKVMGDNDRDALTSKLADLEAKRERELGQSDLSDNNLEYSDAELENFNKKQGMKEATNYAGERVPFDVGTAFDDRNTTNPESREKVKGPAPLKITDEQIAAAKAKVKALKAEIPAESVSPATKGAIEPVGAADRVATAPKQAQKSISSEAAARSLGDDLHAKMQELQQARLKTMAERAKPTTDGTIKLASPEDRANAKAAKALYDVGEQIGNPLDLSKEIPADGAKFSDDALAQARADFAKRQARIDSADADFSESKGTGGRKETEAQLNERVKGLVGEDLIRALKLVGGDIAGNKEAIGALIDDIIHVSTRAEDNVGVTHHEVWHAVSKFLRKMSGGKEVLDSIYKHMDSPAMRAQLEHWFSDDPGAQKQFESKDERAAYAFQKFMDGEPINIAPEVRGVWGKIKNWLSTMMNKLGFMNEGKHTENFFNYLKQGDFLRDTASGVNAESVVRGLGKTEMDKIASNIDHFTGPLKGAVNAVFGHTDGRMRQMGIKAYQRVADMYNGGGVGKSGYAVERQGAINMLGAVLDRAKAVDGGVDGPVGRKMIDSAITTYAKKEGFEPADIKRVVDSAKTFDQEYIYKNFKDFSNDVVLHSDAAKGGAEARDLAQKVLDEGVYYDPRGRSLFNNAKIAQKWESQALADNYKSVIYHITRDVERKRYFGANDEDLNAALAEGDAEATPDQRAIAKAFVDSYENRLGAGTMSPATKTLMGILLTANNVRLLPSAIFSQMMEPMQLAFRKNSMDTTFNTMFRGIADLPRSFDRMEAKHTKDYWERLSEDCGSIASSSMGSMISNIQNGMQLHGFAKKVNEQFFKYNFMEQWNKSMHIAATKNAVEFLKDHANNINPPHSERFLSELGLKASDIKTDENGLLVRDGSTRSDKVDKGIRQFVAESMAHPDAGSNPLWGNDPRFALLMQMKRFTFAHSQFILKRGVKEWNNKNKFVLAPAVLAVPWMMAADALRDFTNPMETDYAKSMTFTDRLENAYDRTGAEGRWQFLHDAKTAFAHGNPTDLLGPTADLVKNVGKAAVGGSWLTAISGTPGNTMPD